MKLLMIEKMSKEVPSFGTLPREVRMDLGVLELFCAVGLVLPGRLHWLPSLTVVAATALAVESLVVIWVHTKYREGGTMVMCGVLGLVMAFIADGRTVLRPIV